MTAESASRPGVFIRVRAYLSLSRVQATLGILAATLSIGGALYGYLRPSKPVVIDQGEIVAIVQEAGSGKALTDATVELLTPKDALVTTLPATGEGRHKLKEGAYKLRVTHPKYVSEVRPIQIVAGQTAEIRVRLAPRPAETPLDSLKKIFR
jgi:hypothetical protein